MGLDTTHGAFHGAYSAFNRFRQAVAKAAGCSYPPHDKIVYLGFGEEQEVMENPDNGFWHAPTGWNEKNPGLTVFFTSNDCEGEFSPEVCKQMADELEVLLPEIAKQGSGGGHIERDGGYVEVTKRYIAGCQLAYENNETMEYH